MSEQKIIPFMAYRKYAGLFSIVLILISLASLVTRGLNFGIDFSGGTAIKISMQDPVIASDVQALLADDYEGVKVQNIAGNSQILVTVKQDENEVATNIIKLISSEIGEVLEASPENRSASFGEEMKWTGLTAMLIALALVMLYVGLRFQFKFSVGAVTALIHDVIITLGFFSVFQINFDQTVLAAVLAVIGYSLNDTIVVSDRIRENFRNINNDDVIHIIDVSLSQTLGRTIITSVTTLMVLSALLVFGGDSLFGFALALFVGVFVGTYSSIYVAANILLLMAIDRKDLLVVVKPEDGEDEEIPDWLKDD
ncbi:MAG: protein translocase subunit SecF [Saccharospirillaceae bacterium]|nr:protein translocase subunit SecF [Pseudomonadales bacterium]NRB77957.1 protein translocase subunit SecF [Saccharospirillaceae bacterium]